MKPMKRACVIIALAAAMAFSSAPYSCAEPIDEGALHAQSWDYYNKGDFEKAYEGFGELYRLRPDSKDYVFGLVNAMVKTKRLKEALGLIHAAKSRDKRLGAMEADVYAAKASIEYEGKLYQEAEADFKSVLALKPGDRGARTLLGWTIFHQGRYDEARQIFMRLYGESAEPSLAEAILLAYRKSGDRPGADAFAETLANSSNEGQRKAAADYYYDCGMPVKAARTWDKPGTCYYKADAGSVEISSIHRAKSGDAGLSKLDETVFPVTYSHVGDGGIRFDYSIKAIRLSSGSAPDKPLAGSYYNQEQKNKLITSLWTEAVEFKADKEGMRGYEFSIGSTPLIAPVSPMPTFSAVAWESDYKISAHQESVKDSILSYAGLNDPYGDGGWGRVLRTGLDAEYNVKAFSPYWLTVNAGYDYYWGKRVWDNQSMFASAAMGRTFVASGFDASPGMLVLAKRFRRNSNFFTLGHGGYYSPQEFYMAGPFVSIKTRDCKSYSASAELAVNYYQADQDDSPAYPLDNGRGETHKGDKTSGVGYSIKLGGRRFITSDISLSGRAEYGRTADYHETLAGIYIKHTF